MTGRTVNSVALTLTSFPLRAILRRLVLLNVSMVSDVGERGSLRVRRLKSSLHLLRDDQSHGPSPNPEHRQACGDALLRNLEASDASILSHQLWSPILGVPLDPMCGALVETVHLLGWIQNPEGG